jgi:hypothetical protein
MLSKTYLGLVIGIVIISLVYLIVQAKYPSLTEGFAEKHHAHHKSHEKHHKHHAHHSAEKKEEAKPEVKPEVTVQQPQPVTPSILLDKGIANVDDVRFSRGIHVVKPDPGVLIEKSYNEAGNDRYGVGQYPNGQMRVFTSDGFPPAELHLSYAKGPNNFNDVVTVKRDGLYVNNGGKINSMLDNRAENQPPKWYRGKGVGEYTEFKGAPWAGINGYSYVKTVVPWPDQTGGLVKQVAQADDGTHMRHGSADDSSWSDWKLISYGNDSGSGLSGKTTFPDDVFLNYKALHFDGIGNDSSDPYFIQKISNPANVSHLRLTINDDADESFQIWGNSCGEQGGCGGPGAMKHQFVANGDAIHKGKLFVNEIHLGNTVLSSGDGNSLKIQTPTGTTEIGSQNDGWSHIYSDRPAFAFNKPVTDVGRGAYSEYRRRDQ